MVFGGVLGMDIREDRFSNVAKFGSMLAIPSAFMPVVYFSEVFGGIEDLDKFLINGFLICATIVYLLYRLIGVIKLWSDLDYVIRVRSDVFQTGYPQYDGAFWERTGYGEYLYLFEGKGIPSRYKELVLVILDKFRSVSIISFFVFVVSFILGADLDNVFGWFVGCCIAGAVFSGAFYAFCNGLIERLKVRSNVSSDRVHNRSDDEGSVDEGDDGLVVC